MKTDKNGTIKLNEDEAKCLEILDKSYGNDLVYSFSYYEADTGLDRKRVRRAIRSLARRGFAEYHKGLMDDDGMVAGSGYIGTKKGSDFLQEQQQKLL